MSKHLESTVFLSASVPPSKDMAVLNGVVCGMQILARRCEDYRKHSSPFQRRLLLAFRTQAQAKYHPRMLEVRRDGFRTAFQIAKQARGSSGFYWPTTVWTNSHILVSIFLSCCLHTPSRVLTTHRVGSNLRRIWWCKPCHPAACVLSIAHPPATLYSKDASTSTNLLAHWSDKHDLGRIRGPLPVPTTIVAKPARPSLADFPHATTSEPGLPGAFLSFCHLVPVLTFFQPTLLPLFADTPFISKPEPTCLQQAATPPH